MIAMACHIGSLVLTLLAKTPEALYWSVFLIALANGMVEAFINPVVATAFKNEKSKWLNILHAGWPAGLALGALTSIILGDASWQLKYAMCFIPVVIYAVLIIPRTFPVNERVAANIPYRDMLAQVGAIGFFILTVLLVLGIGLTFVCLITITKNMRVLISGPLETVQPDSFRSSSSSTNAPPSSSS